jgi:hypothetical protein
LTVLVGCAGSWFVLFFSIYCRKKYKKKIFKFGKLSRLISAAVHISTSIEFLIVFPILVVLTFSNNSLFSFNLIFQWPYILGMAPVFLIGGIAAYWAIKIFVVNLKKVKERNIWFFFTKTDVQTRKEEDWDSLI